jgi:hypothetical protein
MPDAMADREHLWVHRRWPTTTIYVSLTAVLFVFLCWLGVAGTDPDPRQYDYITDPTLRRGVIDQARRGRAETRDRVTKTFTLRNCEADFPPPSEN